MIYVEDQLVKVNGVVLPGLIKSIEVKESALVDEQEVEGSAVKPKQAIGYEDARITVELILDDTPKRTKYQALEIIRALFRKPGQTVPQPIPIISEDIAKHGIDRVLFKGFSHKAEAKKEQLTVSLEFWEYIPQTIKVTRADSSGEITSSSSDDTAVSSILSESYESYLVTDRGVSPASDDVTDTESAGLQKVAEMPF